MPRKASRFVYVTRVNVPDYMVRSGITYKIITDHLGSVRLVVNVETGEIAQRMDYDEWGRVLEDTNPEFQPFGFAGGLYNADTGLVRFGHRDYDPAIGRWLAKDPILFASGDPNLYMYCAGDSVNRTDPSGTTFLSNIGFLIKWLVGTQDDEQINGDDLKEQEFANSPGVEALLAAFYSEGCKNIAGFEYDSLRAWWDALANPFTADWSGTGAQVGGFGNATAINNGNGTVTLTVVNIAGTHSFFSCST